MPRYVKGQRQPGQGGRRNPPGGRPTVQAVAIRESLKQAIERMREEQAQEFAKAYLVMAKRDPPTMRHFIDKVLPQKVEIENRGTVDRQAILAIIATPETHSYVEKLAEAITQRRSEGLPVTVSAPCQLPPPPPTPEEKTEHPQVKFHNFSNGNGKRRK